MHTCTVCLTLFAFALLAISTSAPLYARAIIAACLVWVRLESALDTSLLLWPRRHLSPTPVGGRCWNKSYMGSWPDSSPPARVRLATRDYLATTLHIYAARLTLVHGKAIESIFDGSTCGLSCGCYAYRIKLTNQRMKISDKGKNSSLASSQAVQPASNFDRYSTL